LNSTCRDLIAHGVLTTMRDGVSSTLTPAILTGWSYRRKRGCAHGKLGGLLVRRAPATEPEDRAASPRGTALMPHIEVLTGLGRLRKIQVFGKIATM
jgi:hypothetical protein